MAKKQDAVIFDLDGTIACTKLAYKTIDSPDTWCWDKFKELMSEAPVISGIFDLWHMYHSHNIKIIVLTARPEFLRQETEKYLKNNDLIEYTELVMMGDYYFEIQEKSRDNKTIHNIQAEFKQDALKDLKKRYNLVAAFDDADTNVKMFMKNGITAFHLVR